MSEQLVGQAAGEPQSPQPPQCSTSTSPGMSASGGNRFLDSRDVLVGGVALDLGLNEDFGDREVALTRHIIACVNFCGEMTTELLEFLGSGTFKIQVSRITLDREDPTVSVTAKDQPAMRLDSSPAG